MKNNWSILEEIENNIEFNKYEGFDPYDFIGNSFFSFFLKRYNLFSRYFRGVLSSIENFNPLLIRKLFLIKKSKNNKSIGLLAQAFLIRYQYTHDNRYLEKAESLLNELINNPSIGYKGLCWGYPFHWYSRIYLRKNTPSTVVTSIIAFAFFKHYEITRNKKYFTIIEKIKLFYLEDLNLFKVDSKGFCFSYTPLDNFKVHNANLFTGVFFANYYSVFRDNDSLFLCKQIVNYVISEQNSDGSFNYWSLEPDSIIDHFHTGYVLRHLNSIMELTGLDYFRHNIENGIDYFIENLYTSNGVPKFSNDLEYPIDCHSVSESILCFIHLRKFSAISNRSDLLIKSMDLLINEFYKNNGEFIYQITGPNKKLIINFIRWSQSWAYLALTSYHFIYENRNATIN